MRGDYGSGALGHLLPFRAIPTCVGTTRENLGHRHHLPGHPHMRGDYSRNTNHDPVKYGPSPHAWGLRAAPACPNPVLIRAIPTCVGTTSLARVRTALFPGHPHMRGDYGLRRR
ncbi:conserved hypothetical protein [Thermus scotoductus SA-01]|uniref:Uncharacterized protein n=1 Tax=Thermus scotoductus (strain ATCC 700910 / SA-01) TaxID=743525 RepID=E8PQU3_THESS|nr:conserved hypothetical protein [Thermus scotoductus SA-01]